MDHLPAVASPLRPLSRVPYLSRDLPRYTQSHFEDYPEQFGLDARRLEAGDLGRYTIDTAIPILQEWFFFGLMTEMFESAGITVHRDDFLVNGDQSAVSTKELPRYLWYWTAAETCSPHKKGLERMAKVHKDLEFMNTCMNGVIKNCCSPLDSHQNASSSAEYRDVDIILLSIVILGETFLWAREKVFWGWPSNGVRLRWEPPDIMRRLLSSAGWCGAEIRDIYTDCPHVSCMYYLSNFDRKLLGKDHSACGERCLANQIDETTYITRHVTDDCKCNHHFVEESTSKASIFSILNRGSVPVICVSSTDGELAVHVQDAEVNRNGVKTFTPYVAVTHVWSDGLGNPRTNSLPRCQLERIQKMVDELYEPEDGESGHTHAHMPFWIDTLCVPLQDRYRKLAIGRMSKTYREANRVLVLDSSFRNVSVHSTTEECYMRIKMSSWATRLWTYQEGVLSRRIFFQFQDGPLNAELLEEAYLRDRSGFRLVSQYIDRPERIVGNPLATRLARALVVRLQSTRQRLWAPSDAEIEYMNTNPDSKEEFEQILATHPPELQDLWESIALQCPDFPDEADDRVLAAIERPLNDVIYIEGQYALKKCLGLVFRRISPDDEISWWPEVAFFDFARAVNGRMTSKADDETLCLGGILGLDISPLLKHKGEDRMKSFLSLLGSYRADLIFSKTERIQEDGYRWAPKSFLHGAMGDIETARQAIVLAPRHSKGLLVEWPGLWIRPTSGLPADDTLLAMRERAPGDHDGWMVDIRAIRAYAAHESEGFGVFTIRLDTGGPWSQYSTRGKLAIIRNHLARARGILVTVEEEDGDTIFVRFETHVSIDYQYELDGRKMGVQALVEHIHYKQRWCVG